MTPSITTQPRAHQITAFTKAHGLENFAYWCEMGTGKSLMLLTDMVHLYATGKIEAALIIAPKGAYANWTKNEIPKHIHGVMCAAWGCEMRAIAKVKLNLLLASDAPKDTLKIFVMNVEALAHKKGVAFANYILTTFRCMLAIDESTAIKNHKAARTKAAIKLGRLAVARRVMTGTPITNNPLDVYSQCAFLDPKLLGFASFFAFRARYAEMKEVRLGPNRPTFMKVTGFRNLDELQKKLDTFGYRVTKAECLDLPPKIYTKRYVELTDGQTKVYEKLRDEMMVQLEQGTITVQLAITKMLRLHQIICGHLVMDDGVILDLPNNRVGALLEVIEEAAGKVIIWCAYQRDVEIIARKLRELYLPPSVVTYYGRDTQGDREEAYARFQNPTSLVRFFVGTAKTGGLGLTLTQATTTIYYSNNFDLGIRLQSEDRCHRIGQTKPVTYVDLIAEGTLDEKILEVLSQKKSLASFVMDDWRKVLT